jgi:hypothetical protein
MLCLVQYVDLIKGHLDKAAAEAKAAGREGANTDTQALATRIHDTMYKHFGESAHSIVKLDSISGTGHPPS